MTWSKKYHWSRTWGAEAGLNRLPHEDFTAWDGEQIAGRVMLDQQTEKAGQWRWSGGYVPGVPPIMPHTGWKPTVEEAARQVEEWWDQMKAGR